MMILWLGFMALFLVALGAPLAQKFAYAGSHRGLAVEVVEGVAVTVAGVVIFAGLLAAAGYVAFGLSGAFGMGLIGAFVGFIVVSIVSTFMAAAEQRN
jgi:hypothetical protein